MSRNVHNGKGPDWPLQYFAPAELASKGNGDVYLDVAAGQKMDMTRHIFGKPLFITSAYRDPAHNARVGGAKSSFHLKGRAFDVVWGNMTAREKADLLAAAQKAGFTGFGFYSNFIHLDDGPARLWVG